jgi:hypothetical protein
MCHVEVNSALNPVPKTAKGLGRPINTNGSTQKINSKAKHQQKDAMSAK